ncbi:hypothetical protein F2Q69_00039511 [Brassica cretica]|uniref:Uncharacterized protein n=1 Tax=Brassica cretica TaxID=69181 RepID=A0A8S9NEQ4_BRACR|nr:hypothetical protein F2Q69_00039511 [Brassica cretica]
MALRTVTLPPLQPPSPRLIPLFCNRRCSSPPNVKTVANMIRFLVDSYNKPVPAILEIPSKDHPYDPAHDSVLSRVKYLFSAESVSQR